MKTSNYINWKWWTSHLDNLFPEFRTTLPAQWQGPETFVGGPTMRWYTNQDVLLGFRMADGHWPTFIIKLIKNGKVYYTEVSYYTKNDSNVSQLLTVIETIAKPDLCPLCIGIPWAEPLVEHLLSKN